MKNQYFGDINDYRKYGLLRALQSGSGCRLLVAWMLIPDDGGRDGGLRFYLQRPEEWRRFDPELFNGLAGALRMTSTPQVSLIEGSSLLPCTTFYSAVVPDARGERDLWRQGLMEAISGVDLMFVDPDNGIEIPSKPVGRKGSSKYITGLEIQQLWAAGCSLLIYQHFRREPRDRFSLRMASELQSRTGASLVEAFRTPRVLFLLAAQQRHQALLQHAISRRLPAWRGQVDAVGRSAG
jgi:hypothetical protein